MKYSIAIVLISLPLLGLSQKHKFNFDFALIFGGCFHKDSVSIDLNGINIISNAKIETNVVGSARFSVSQDKNYLLVKSEEKIKRLKKVNLKQSLNFHIFINSKEYNYTFNIKNGRILYAENCTIEGDLKRINTLTITQQDSPVIFF